MQMSFAALFSHVTRLPRGAPLLISFEYGAAREYPGWVGIVTRYYFPLLESIRHHAANEFGVTLQVLSPLTDPLYFAWKDGNSLPLAGTWAQRFANHAHINLGDDPDLWKAKVLRRFNISLAPWCFRSIVRRQCPRRKALRLRADATGVSLAGHCGAFFSGPAAVAAWRRFLVRRHGMLWGASWGSDPRDMEANNRVARVRPLRGRELPQRPLRVLILNRCAVHATRTGHHVQFKVGPLLWQATPVTHCLASLIWASGAGARLIAPPPILAS